MKRNYADESKSEPRGANSAAHDLLLPADHVRQSHPFLGDTSDSSMIPPPMPAEIFPQWKEDVHLNEVQDDVNEIEAWWWGGEYWYWDPSYHIWWTQSHKLYHPDSKRFSHWGGGNSMDTHPTQDASRWSHYNAAPDLKMEAADLNMVSTSSSSNQPGLTHYRTTDASRWVNFAEAEAADASSDDL